MHLLAELGLQVQAEFPVGKYHLDVFCEEVWLGFEADGRVAHAGRKRQEKDAYRDKWIYENAGIAVMRLDEQVLRKRVWEVTQKAVQDFIERYAEDLQQRKERGAWTLASL